MSLAASVVNGELVQQTTSANSANGKSQQSSGSTMDKESFLQLLVAQMKYQDPMEPTSNTEYVAQYAQFSELEAMQNLSSNMDIQRATGLVGKEVIMKTTGASGEPIYVQGKVDFVSMEGSKAYLTINGSKYSIDDLDTVVDEDYMNAVNLANDFTNSLNKLPQLALLTSEYKDVIENLTNVYNDMTAYQRSYLSQDTVNKFNQYAEQMKQILAAQESAATE
ncbi:MAG: flagellar hook capping protein [Lachnospiraceae bacterium]|nr:flagellar hook capping protein [Lachnospiraceae bacterium]